MSCLIEIYMSETHTHTCWLIQHCHLVQPYFQFTIDNPLRGYFFPGQPYESDDITNPINLVADVMINGRLVKDTVAGFNIASFTNMYLYGM